ncbi:MAG: hypothetical protein RL291_1239 [Pseudomonadota bacterium]
MASVPAVGLDFGTTNTVLARVGADGRAVATAFHHENETITAFRSVLALWQELEDGGRVTRTEAGPWAIDRFIADPSDCRFLQSFKTFAASRAFQTTTIAGKSYAFEDLLAGFFRKYREHAGVGLDGLPTSLVLGRPVTFAGNRPDPELARTRYENAFRSVGFETFHHVYEPVAAAYYFAQRLERDATVLVADFGGGTSDFSVIHFAKGRQGVTAKPLAQTGVGVAGDTFDYRIIDAVLSPRLGKGTRFKSWGKVLDVPAHYYTNFARWNELSLLKSSRVLNELREIARDSLAKDKIEAFLEFIAADVGSALYKAVSATKMQLSQIETARLRFADGGVSIDQVIKRVDFERWIAPDIDRIDRAVDAALAKARCTEASIDKVFLTGGSSFVPAVQARFARRFGREKAETGDQLLSIAYGLALIGQDHDIARWCVTPQTDAAARFDADDDI